MLKLIKFVFKSIVFIFTILVLIAVFVDSDDETKSTSKATDKTTVSKPVVQPEPVVGNTTTYFCDATTKYGKGYQEFTVDGNAIVSMIGYEDNYDPMTFSNPSKNWTYLGNGKFKHRLYDDAKECSTTNTFTTTDTRSQYMYASQESLLGYVKKRVKAEAGTSQVKYHSILGASYRTFPDWGPSKETLQGRVRYSVNITITNVFGGKELYTAVVFANGSKVEEYTIRAGHM